MRWINLSLSDDKKVYNIILNKSIKERIEEIAKLEARSTSNLVNLVLKNFIEEYSKKENK